MTLYTRLRSNGKPQVPVFHGAEEVRRHLGKMRLQLAGVEGLVGLAEPDGMLFRKVYYQF